MNDGTRMKRALAKLVLAPLLEAGFTGSHPHLRRTVGVRMELVSFQTDKWGGGFLIELATCPSKNIRDWAGQRVAAARVTAHHMAERVRLPKVVNRRAWYRYDTSTDEARFDKIAKQALTHLQRHISGLELI
jgi:hypothetical protein